MQQTFSEVLGWREAEGFQRDLGVLMHCLNKMDTAIREVKHVLVAIILAFSFVLFHARVVQPSYLKRLY